MGVHHVHHRLAKAAPATNVGAAITLMVLATSVLAITHRASGHTIRVPEISDPASDARHGCAWCPRHHGKGDARNVPKILDVPQATPEVHLATASVLLDLARNPPARHGIASDAHPRSILRRRPYRFRCPPQMCLRLIRRTDEAHGEPKHNRKDYT